MRNLNRIPRFVIARTTELYRAELEGFNWTPSNWGVTGPARVISGGQNGK